MHSNCDSLSHRSCVELNSKYCEKVESNFSDEQKERSSKEGVSVGRAVQPKCSSRSDSQFFAAFPKVWNRVENRIVTVVLSVTIS